MCPRDHKVPTQTLTLYIALKKKKYTFKMGSQVDSYMFLVYAALCCFLGVTYVKVKSSEGVTITTNEFTMFHNGFLTAHGAIFLGELLSLGSFYPTFLSMGCTLDQITKLYIVYVISNTICAVLLDIVDFGTRKDKCVLSAILYGVSLMSLFLDDHYDMLLLGRVIYGAGCALHHSAFHNYVGHQHETMGFPEDWLSYTYSVMTHSMGLIAGLAGIMGHTASSTGALGSTGMCCMIFAITAAYIVIVWEKDLSTSRFMWTTFVYNTRQVVDLTKNKTTVLYVLGIGATFESAVTIFTFYWAPWLTNMVIVRDQLDNRLIPYELIYSSIVVATLLGNYLNGMYGPSFGTEISFQAVLVASSLLFFLSATMYSVLFSFVVALLIQMGMGGYWPTIGELRARYVPHEQRNTFINMGRLITMIISCIVLRCVYDSGLLIMSICGLLCCVAAYLQHEMVTIHALEGDDFDEFEKDKD